LPCKNTTKDVYLQFQLNVKAIYGFDLIVFYIWLSRWIIVRFLFFSSQIKFNWKLDFNAKNLVWNRVVCECFTVQLSKSGCIVKDLLHRYNIFYVRTHNNWTVLQETMKTKKLIFFSFWLAWVQFLHLKQLMNSTER
jgi:hypothetical protein